MRTLLALLAALVLTAAVPTAQAAVTVPEELCNPGQLGTCHWYTDHGQCATLHVGTHWAGACTTGDPEAPARACSTVVTPLWHGWCPQDGTEVDRLLGEILAPQP
jgi:hypothetical protein